MSNKPMDKTLSELLDEMNLAYEKSNSIERREIIDGLFKRSSKGVSNAMASGIVTKILKQEEIIMTKKEPVAEKKETAIEKTSEVVLPEVVKQEVAMVEKKDGRNLSVTEIITLAGILYKSRLFSSLQSAEQAVAQIIAGQELGLAPVYSLNHLYIIPNKPPAVDGQAMANMVRRAGYSYKAIRHTASDSWTLGFYKGAEFLGEASFTIAEANKVGLTKKGVWQQYADDMLFWRCLSRGARRWCPDAISGAYLLEELDIEVGSVAPSDIVVEGDKDAKGKNEPKALEPGAEQKPEPPTRDTMLQELVNKHGKEKCKKIKDKLEIKSSLKSCTEKEFEEFKKALDK